MSEHSADVGRGIRLAYELLGPDDGVPVLLIAGLGQQLHTWPDGFCDLLVARGMRVLRFDNRDSGHSTHADFPPPGPGAILRSRWHPRQYRLGDLATDTVGLLREIGWDSAHLVGASMGGMIGQTVAARHPERVRSLTSIMSTTGAPKVGRPALSTWLRMAGPAPRSEKAYVAQALRIFRHIGSAGFPLDEDALRISAALAWQRDPSSAGTPRQLGAIFASGNRTRELATITAPTLVIHGDRDRMVNPTGGEVTERAIRGARRVTIPGMGHDLPSGVWPQVAGLIADHVAATETAITERSA